MYYPRELSRSEVSSSLSSLVFELARRLLGGSTDQHQVLQAQLASAQIDRITLTGTGLYAYFEVSSKSALVSPLEMIGGEVVIETPDLDVPAGSLIKVREGKIYLLEIYTFGDKAWPDDPKNISFGFSEPLPVSY
ncbi:MAG TPA: hypothetical protein VFW00_12220 [Rhodocyclaceae bacterium]|nr:hypothetical protein [Rhodocyclaceae bacterium]